MATRGWQNLLWRTVPGGSLQNPCFSGPLSEREALTPMPVPFSPIHLVPYTTLLHFCNYEIISLHTYESVHIYACRAFPLLSTANVGSHVRHQEEASALPNVQDHSLTPSQRPSGGPLTASRALTRVSRHLGRTSARMARVSRTCSGPQAVSPAKVHQGPPLCFCNCIITNCCTVDIMHVRVVWFSHDSYSNGPEGRCSEDYYGGPPRHVPRPTRTDGPGRRRPQPKFHAVGPAGRTTVFRRGRAGLGKDRAGA